MEGVVEVRYAMMFTICDIRLRNIRSIDPAIRTSPAQRRSTPFA